MSAAIAFAHIADAYFSLKTLAGYSGLSVRRLRDYLADRQHPLPYYRIGGKILVRRSDFDAWAAQFRRDPQAIDALVDDLVKGL
jgi:excisionase family DNA binding protein